MIVETLDKSGAPPASCVPSPQGAGLFGFYKVVPQSRDPRVGALPPQCLTNGELWQDEVAVWPAVPVPHPTAA